MGCGFVGSEGAAPLCTVCARRCCRCSGAVARAGGWVVWSFHAVVQLETTSCPPAEPAALPALSICTCACSAPPPLLPPLLDRTHSSTKQVIRENQVVVVVGETGSGKTTQMTQVGVGHGGVGTSFVEEAGALLAGLPCCNTAQMRICVYMCG